MRVAYLSRQIDKTISGELIYLPPWRWGVKDQGAPRDGVITKRWLPTGQRVSETTWDQGRVLMKTTWRRDGSVAQQNRFLYDGDELSDVEVRREKPWWNDAAGKPISD